MSYWRLLHDMPRLQTPPEPYQFAPLARLLAGPRRGLLIADVFEPRGKDVRSPADAPGQG